MSKQPPIHLQDEAAEGREVMATSEVMVTTERIDRLEHDWGTGVAHVQLLAARLDAPAKRVADLEASRTHHGKIILKLEGRVAELEKTPLVFPGEWTKGNKFGVYNIDETEEE